MNGVLLLCLRSGTCLYSKQYKESFGLPSGVLSASDQPGAMDAVSLSGIFYALFLQSNASHSFDETDATEAAIKKAARIRRSTGRSDGLDIRMQSMSVGDAVLHFAVDRRVEVMVVSAMESSITEPNAVALTARLMMEIKSKYQTPLSSTVRNTKGFKGMSALLCSVYQEFPDMVARSALRKLAGVGPDWLYVAHIRSFSESVQSSAAQEEQGRNRNWWRLSRSSSASVPRAVSPGPFQYVYRSETGPTTVYPNADALSGILTVVQRGFEILAAFSRDAAEPVRSMEILVQLNSTAEGGDWLDDCVRGNATGSSPQSVPQFRRSVRIFVLIEEDTMIVIPLFASPGASGLIGKVRRVIHEDVTELIAFMKFLQSHIPEHRVKGKLSPSTYE